MDIFGGSRQNWTSFSCLFYVLGPFLMVNVQSENIFEWRKFHLIFPIFSGRKGYMLGPILRMKKK